MSRTTCSGGGGSDKKGEDNGLLFLLVIRDRRSRLEVGRGLEPIITDGRSGATLRADASGAARKPVRRSAVDCGDLVRRASSRKTRAFRSIMGVRGRRPAPQPVYDGVPWPLILGGLFLLLMIMGRGGRRGGGGGSAASFRV